jgi:cobalt-zinc-cadmium resistance protein CzcA
MLERIVSFTLRQRGLVIVFVVALVAIGIYSFAKLPIDAFPDVTGIQVEIVSNASGLSALEIERFVTYPIEMAMRGIPDIVQMRSVTKFGLSVVTLVFQDNVDIYFARQLVFEKLEDAKSKVPQGVTIEMGPIATALGEIYQYTLEAPMPADSAGKARALTEMRTLQDWVIAPQLKSIPGVNDINSFGGYFKQFHVAVAPNKLLQYDLTVDDVFRALEKNNQNVGGNVLDRFDEQYIVRGIGLLRSDQDIKNIVLKSAQGTPVFIRDVADVHVGEAVRQGAAFKDVQGEAVGGIVLMLKGKNSLDVVERVKEKVAEINGGNVLPAGMHIVPYYDRTDVIESSIRTVVEALSEGAILVLIVLYILLRNVRGALVVLLALPLSFCATFIVMKSTGLTANLMSLGGLAISIGMIIDATIIQVENVQRRFGELTDDGPAKFEGVLRAVLEVQKPSIFGELIIMLTFLPILSLEGMEGKMFQPLALTVAIALASSLLLSIFVIPVLCYLFLKPGKEKRNPLMQSAAEWHQKALAFALRNRTLVIGAAGLAVAGALVLATRLGTEFIPIMDEGAFDMDIQLLPGVSLTKSMEITKLVHEKVKAFPELETVVSRTGQTGIAVEARGVDKTGFTGVFKPRSQWTSGGSKEEIINSMRKSVSTIPGMAFSFSQPIQCRIDELVAGTRAQLIVKLFGEDIEVLKSKAEDITAVLRSIRGATDIIMERVAGQPYLNVTVDRNKLARHGLNVGDVLNVIEISVGGKTATQLYEENRSFDVTVRYPEDDRNSVESIGNTLILTPGGYKVPLDEIAAIKVIEGPVQISREDGMRRIGIELNVSGRDIGSLVAEAKAQIARKVKLPTGYYTSWGGQFENQERAMRTLMIIVPLTVGMIFLLLLYTFKSWRLALLVIFNLPVALVGGVIALALAGLYLSVPASVGFIVLFGVAVLNGVVLVSHISRLRQEGLPLAQALSTGCRDRLRPVLMTASIAIFSLIPMLYATGPGSEIQRPLVIVVIGGLFTSTVLTLLVIPTLYGWFEKGWSRRSG